MRKSIDGLSAIAQYAIGKNPLEAHLFAFCSKDQSRIKLLYWDRNGFWLFYKRLENGIFRWPASAKAPLYITRSQLSWLLDGLSIDQAGAHRPLHATVAA
jgi:transposase